MPLVVERRRAPSVYRRLHLSLKEYACPPAHFITEAVLWLKSTCRGEHGSALAPVGESRRHVPPRARQGAHPVTAASRKRAGGEAERAPRGEEAGRSGAAREDVEQLPRERRVILGQAV